MSDLELAYEALRRLMPSSYMEESVLTLRAITERNQNPGCGGDGSMSEKQWMLLREIQVGIHEVMKKMLQCAKDTGPKICDSELWKLENNKKD